MNKNKRRAIKLRMIGTLFLMGVIILLMFSYYKSYKESLVIEMAAHTSKFATIAKLPNSPYEYICVDERGNIFYVDAYKKKEQKLFAYDDITDNMISTLKEKKKQKKKEKVKK